MVWYAIIKLAWYHILCMSKLLNDTFCSADVRGDVVKVSKNMEKRDIIALARGILLFYMNLNTVVMILLYCFAPVLCLKFLFLASSIQWWITLMKVNTIDQLVKPLYFLHRSGMLLEFSHILFGYMYFGRKRSSHTWIRLVLQAVLHDDVLKLTLFQTVMKTCYLLYPYSFFTTVGCLCRSVCWSTWCTGK